VLPEAALSTSTLNPACEITNSASAGPKEHETIRLHRVASNNAPAAPPGRF
jgi:hypothetical protein